MHFLAVLFCSKAHQCSDTECLHPPACCVRFSTDVQDVTTRNVVLTQTVVCFPHLVGVSEIPLPLTRHTVKVVYGMGGGIRKVLILVVQRRAHYVTRGLFDCLQAALPASRSVRVCCCEFVVTLRLMEPAGSISCSRNKPLLF
jgi:hypothetical protein